MAPFGNVPDIGRCDSLVGPHVLGGCRDAAKGVEGIVTGIVRGIVEHLNGKGALLSPPRMGVSTRGMAALHGH